MHINMDFIERIQIEGKPDDYREGEVIPCERVVKVQVNADKALLAVALYSVEEGCSDDDCYAPVSELFDIAEASNPEYLADMFGSERVDVFRQVVKLCGKAYNAYTLLQQLKD